MKKFTPIILLVFFLFISCEPKLVKEGREVYREYLSKNLKDPNSLKIYNESYYLPNGEDGIVSEFTVDYGATNSYGAMVRDELKFKIVAKKITEINDKSSYEDDKIEKRINHRENEIDEKVETKYLNARNNVTLTKESYKSKDVLFGKWLIEKKFNPEKESYIDYTIFNSKKSTMTFLDNNIFDLRDLKIDKTFSFIGDYLIKDSIYYLSKNGENYGYLQILNYKQNTAEVKVNVYSKTNKYIISRIIQ